MSEKTEEETVITQPETPKVRPAKPIGSAIIDSTGPVPVVSCIPLEPACLEAVALSVAGFNPTQIAIRMRTTTAKASNYVRRAQRSNEVMRRMSAAFRAGVEAA